MSNNVTKSGESVSEKQETYTGKLIGGGIAAVLGGVIGAMLIGGYAILPAAVVVGLLGVALGAVFD
jgi:predicted benzoate:H+ symporter BenE